MTADVADPTAAVIALLTRLKWVRREEDLAPPKEALHGRHLPVFDRGKRRAVVGPVWVTFYTRTPGGMADVRSVRTARPDDVAAEAKG